MPRIADNNEYYLNFSYFGKFGPRKMLKLKAYFPDLKTAFYASQNELEAAGLTSKLAANFLAWRAKFSPESAWRELSEEKINFVTWDDEEYPNLLREIADPPYILYYRGKLSGEVRQRLAVVGAREHSAYANKIISELLPPLINSGLEIVSGLAIGVDTLAHQIALECQGITWAVLGSGLDNKNIYPGINRQLAEKIIVQGGALISEFPPGTKPLKENFPRRNRIISGLCQATLVIEAKNKSGSLITAYSALEQNREVLAVPGNIFSDYSRGTNKLIRVGAKVVLTSEDIGEAFGLLPSVVKNIHFKNNRPPKEFQPENEAEKQIYELLKQASERGEKISADELIRITQLDTATINSTLSMLELKGIAKNDATGYDVN